MKLGKFTKAVFQTEFMPAKKYGKLTSGKALRIYRELQGYTQAELAELTGLKQATISSLENDRVTMGIERSKTLAHALKIHPAVLAFADYEMGSAA
jgi:transcriptional regulator with XRE-family HTH domain